MNYVWVIAIVFFIIRTFDLIVSDECFLLLVEYLLVDQVGPLEEHRFLDMLVASLVCS